MQHALNHSKLFRIGFVAVALVALLSFGLMRFGSIPAAHAAAEPTIVQTATGSNMSGSLDANGNDVMSATFSNNVAGGDEVVALVGWGGGNDWSPSSFSSNLSIDYTPFGIGATVSDGLYDKAKIYGGFAPSTGSETFTITLSENGCPCGSQWVQSTLMLVEVSGAEAVGPGPFKGDGQEYLSESGTGGTSHVTNTGSGLATSDDELDLGIYVDGGSNTTLSVPSGEHDLGSGNSPTVNLQFAFASGDTLSHMEFDTSGTAGYAVINSISIGSI